MPASSSRQLPIIAIDGPAGAGKSTVARLLAERLELPYLDTGAMYRAVGLLALRSGLEPPFEPEVGDRIAALVDEHDLEFHPGATTTTVRLDGEDVSQLIRTPRCSELASQVSALSAVRRALVPLQRELGARAGGVMEGRDIGSVVFPDAEVKVYLTAAADERARRRRDDLRRRGVEAGLDEVRRQQDARDLRDASRSDSPLQVARGAVVLDTTSMSEHEVVERLLQLVERTCPGALDSATQDAVRSRNHGS